MKSTRLLFYNLILSITLMFAFFTSSFLNLNLNTVYAYDNISGSLRDLPTTFTNDTTNFNEFATKNDNEYYFVDTLNSKVIIWNNDSIEELGTFGANDGNFVNPSLISVLPNQDIYVYDSLKRLQKFDNTYTHQVTYNIIKTNDTYISLGSLSSITNDLSNNLYMIDYENNMIIKKLASDDEVFEYINGSNLGITFSSNSQIKVSTYGETIFITNLNGENNIYTIDKLLSLSQVDITPYAITNVSSIATDCANNLFILDKNETSSKFHKLTRNSYAYESNLEVINNELNNISSVNINIENGKMLAINSSSNTLQHLSTVGYENIFTENISSFIDPVDYTSVEALSSEVKVAQVNIQSCPLLQTPYNITPTLNLNINEKVIILSDDVLGNSDYYYVLYTNSHTLVNVDGYILKSNVVVLSNEAQAYDDVRTLNNDTNIYKYPTSLNSSLDVPVILSTVNKNEVLKVINTAYEIIDYTGSKFYQVELSNDTIGYVKQNDVIKVTITTTVPTLITNAEIIITDDSDFVEVYSEENNLQSLMPETLLAEKRIYLSVYNQTKEWTQITFLNQNNEEVTGFIKTKYIKVYGEYQNLLQALLLTLISFILIVVLLIVRTNKKTEE